MQLPVNKTKIVCTLGPASSSPEVMEQMLRAGMNVARLNFSHGDFAEKAGLVAKLRAAARAAGQRVAILADLSGPKMRIGQLGVEPVELEAGQSFTLTTENIVGDARRVSMTFPRLPRVVKPGHALFLNDGLIQLEVVKVERTEVHCRVLVGGELRSRKGLNLPGLDLGISAFTERDHACLKFALEHGMDAVSQSFVQTADDVRAVRAAAAALGHKPFVIAKIERAGALEHLDAILEAADGVMIARGDLGVEVPIEQIAVVQKSITQKANRLGKPVITATQMLESMTTSRLPTRAEATDVANAILDGTDCVMLSGESAMGRYPVEAVAMLAKISAAVEPHRPSSPVRESLRSARLPGGAQLRDVIALAVEDTFKHVTPAAVLVPTLSGATARSIARFRLPAWIVAVSPHEATCQQLLFSHGVLPEYEPQLPENWNTYAQAWACACDLDGNLMILSEGPSSKHPQANHRMELIELKRP
jgi:pyruvate kinase